MHARNTFRIATLTAAVLGAFAPAQAAETGEAAPSRPAVTASFGLGYSDSDGRRFGQYNGINQEGVYGLLDIYANRRDDATGTWLRFDGRNLGLDSRQLRFEHNRQGNWGYFLEFNQIPRYEPYLASTAVGGLTSNALSIPAVPTTGLPFELKTRRDQLGFGFDKIFSRDWDLKVRFRNEEKNGTRIFARGSTGNVAGFAGAFEFAPEPIDSTTRQLEATLGYTGEKLQLSGGYYGTMFSNHFSGMSLTGGVGALGTFNPIALPPDNSSHQFFASGGYSFTPTTRGTFKVSYANAKQDDSFVTGANVPLAPGIGTNLQGKVDTTLYQAGITSRPMPKLTLRADLKQEDRDDKTPVLRYVNLASNTSTGDNEPRSIRTTKGLAEASYLLPHGFRITGGVDNEEKKRNTSSVRVVSFREKTDETSYRVELRRSMSETVTGAIAYVHSDRDGSPFLRTTETSGATGSNLIAPIHLADRKREKIRLSVNWMPADPLTLQFFLDDANDSYSGRDGSGLGPRSGDARNYSLDATYRFSPSWQANAWYNRNETRADQSTCVGASAAGVCPATAANPIWNASLSNVSDSFGVGLSGKPNGKIEFGADLNYSDITDSYLQMAATPATSVAARALPEVVTRLTRFNLFGKFALEKNSGIRLDYIYDRFSTSDWTWTTWRYADGTRLTQDPVQKVNFIGASYYYRWQ